jgi:hypothetical protein
MNENKIEEKNNPNIAGADFIFAILLVVMGFGSMMASLKMPIYNSFLDSPGFFSFILGGVFIVLGILLMRTAVKQDGYEQMKELLSVKKLKQYVKSWVFMRVLILIALMIFYIFALIGKIHFVLATIIYLVITLCYLKATSIINIIIISTGVALGINLLFTKLFNIPLP